MPKTEKRLIGEDYCKQYPNMQQRTLAKKIYEENKKIFDSIESARDVVRRVQGTKGVKQRKENTDKSQHKKVTHNTTYKPYKEEVVAAKILVLDIETAPLRTYVWGIWNQNVGINQIDTDWFCLTWAAKWLFEDKVYSAAVTGKEAKSQNDKRIMKSLWALVNEADIVIAHNAVKFDIPKINSRFVIHKMQPPLPYEIIDTLKHVRKQFGFVSNKLDYVNKLLNLPRKQETGGFELWEKCYKGDEAGIKKMLDYNIQDVRILEETYLRIRAWIKPHPPMNLHILDETQSRCPSCGHSDLTEHGKKYVTTANAYELLRCNNCGATSRKRVTEVNIKQRRHIVISTPK